MRLAILFTLAMATMFALPSMALTINDTPHASEVSIHDIYDSVYGTTHGSSQALWDAVGLDGFELFFAPGDPGGASIEFAAHYAGYDQELGWYNPTDLSDNGLLLVIGSGVSNQTPSFEVVGDFIPSAFFGLYDTVNGDSQTWYSEASENSDGYTHFAIFSTPVVNQYFVGVEDLSLGDQDYNDLVFSLTITPDGPGTNTPEVPEPATVCMVLMGASTLLVRRKTMH